MLKADRGWTGGQSTDEEAGSCSAFLLSGAMAQKCPPQGGGQNDRKLYGRSGGEHGLGLDHLVAEGLGDGTIGDLALVDVEPVAQVGVVDNRLQPLVGELQAIVQGGIVESM